MRGCSDLDRSQKSGIIHFNLVSEMYSLNQPVSQSCLERWCIRKIPINGLLKTTVKTWIYIYGNIRVSGMKFGLNSAVSYQRLLERKVN